MNENKQIAALMRGLRSSPTMKWGDEPINEADLLETLHGDVRFWENFDELVDREPHHLERAMRPEVWSLYIPASREDPVAWKMLHAVVRRFQTGNNLSLLVSSKALGQVWERDAAEGLIEWAVDVAAGIRPMPTPDGRPKETIIHTLIADAVASIKALTGRPYQSRKDTKRYKQDLKDAGKRYEPVSACAVVGKKLGLNYETVSKAWKNYKPDHLRKKDPKVG